jgi:hypothetical protein
MLEAVRRKLITLCTRARSLTIEETRDPATTPHNIIPTEEPT